MNVKADSRCTLLYRPVCPFVNSLKQLRYALAAYPTP